jgi:stage II sporulation protein D
MKSSLIKVSFALAVISLYTYVFAIMDIVDSAAPVVYTQGEQTNTQEKQPAQTTGEVQPPALNAFTGRVPGFADYDSPAALNAADFTTAVTGEDVYDFTTQTLRHEEPQLISQTAQTTQITVTTTPPPAHTTRIGTVTAATTTARRDSTTPPAATTRRNTATTPTPPSIPSPSPSEESLRITANGSTVELDAFEIVTRVVQAEIGSSFHKEAIKAQAVAAYTFIKRQNAAGLAPTLPLAATASDRVKDSVREVWGQAIYHNGELIQAVFSASSAGWTASALNVWGDNLPYLQSVRTSFDEQDPNRGLPISFTSQEIRDNVERHTGIQLTGDPSGWLRINSHVDTVYVGEMSIGGHTSFTSSGSTVNITGRVFRERIMGFALRSASFTFVYDSAGDSFLFTTNGYGHGAGLSQNGANILATHQGYDYVQILRFYYTGVEVR